MLELRVYIDGVKENGHRAAKIRFCFHQHDINKLLTWEYEFFDNLNPQYANAINFTAYEKYCCFS
jgi:hypothetical protein